MADILSKYQTRKGFVLPDGYSWDAKLNDGNKEGKITVEDEFGCISYVLHFKNDKLNGICDFYDLGSLVERLTFVNDIAEGWACVIELGDEVRWYLYSDGVNNVELKQYTNLENYWQAVTIVDNQLVSICKYDDNHFPVDKGYIFDNDHICRVVLFENGKEKYLLKSFEENKIMIEYDNSGNKVYRGGFFDDVSKDYPREGNGMEFVGGVLIYAGEWKNDLEECKAIKKAAELAGLKVLKMIPEPTAAVMSWCLDNAGKLDVGDYMIVYDFGESAFDVSLLQYKGDTEFVIRAFDGNPNLGGSVIDSAILDYLVRKCERIGVDISKKVNSRKYRSILLSDCEDAKISITDNSNTYYDNDENTFLRNSSTVNHPVAFSDLSMDDVDDVDFTTSDLNEAIRRKVEETVDITIRMVQKEKLMFGSIRYVMLVGGSSHLHLIKQLIHKKFIRSKFPIMNLNEAVTIGAMKLLMSDS